MNNKKQKLELTWIGKDEQPRLERRRKWDASGMTFTKSKPLINNSYNYKMQYGFWEKEVTNE